MHPEVDPRRQGGLPPRAPRRTRARPRRARAGARAIPRLPPRRPAALADGPGRAPGVARAPVPDGRPRVRGRREGLHRHRGLLRARAARDLAAGELRPRGREGVRSLPRVPDRQEVTEFADALGEIRIPKTWYLSSDGILDFIEFNQLDDLYDRKYLEIDQVRREYPHVIQVFKNSHFSPEIVKGLSLALDDFGDRPLIVRSSSLLEDRVGAAFSGKYKSLFLANQGPKAERLAALLDAIAEVYASVFGPDPLEYRAERGLLDVHEEMGILLQEVVGNRVGKYFLPTFAGVAFSNNEFRWSPRIAREDGLVRLVPGLGTRAVDRVADDYPILVAPGKPGLRVNVTPSEVVRYAPRKVDVIDLESGRSRRWSSTASSRNAVPGSPASSRSVRGRRERRPPAVLPGFRVEEGPVRRDVRDAPRVDAVSLRACARSCASCGRRRTAPWTSSSRRTGRTSTSSSAVRRVSRRIRRGADPVRPRRRPRDFEAKRFVSNGRVPDLTHVVYVDPEGYGALPDAASLRRVGQAVGRMNKMLPKRQFILMGPGRWGSRGDLRLGVPVRYSDIHNSAALIEIARKRGGYVPDLSFGTHFFQDLVEASIRYLPALPGRSGDPLPRGVPPGVAERSCGPRARVPRPRGGRPRDRRPEGHGRIDPEAPPERGRGPRRRDPRAARRERPAAGRPGREAGEARDDAELVRASLAGRRRGVRGRSSSATACGSTASSSGTRTTPRTPAT